MKAALLWDICLEIEAVTGEVHSTDYLVTIDGLSDR